MKTKITKNKNFLKSYRTLIGIIIAALSFSLLIITWGIYEARPTKSTAEGRETKSRPAYVDGIDAKEQVANFYKQYIDSKSTSSFRQKYVEGYGSKNLIFYSQYYQHGFDPITCSTLMPTFVTTALKSTGPVAIVEAVATYPDKSQSSITATVVLNDKLAIDSVTCPGSKGNLLPKTTL